jgi:hypothetical protein
MLRNTRLNKKQPRCSTTLDSAYSAYSAYESTLKGVAVYSRRTDLVGFVFALEGAEYGEEPGEQGREALSVASLNEAVAGLERVLSSCSSANSLSRPSGLFRYAQIILKINVRLLLVERFCRLLAEASETLTLAGYNLSVAVDSNNLLFVREYRELRQIMFLLADVGVDFTLENPAHEAGLPAQITALEGAFSSVSITPQWLGIHQSEDMLDLSHYMAAVSRLSVLIHEKGKHVIYDGVSNNWQRSFVTSLPVRLYTSPSSSDDICV